MTWERLGVDLDPTSGGAADGILYLVFAGSGAVPSLLESHDDAVARGKRLAAKLVQENP